MNLRKATIRIVLAFVSVIAIGGMIAGCSTDEFEGPRKTLARRQDIPTEDFDNVVNPTDTIQSTFNYYIENLAGDSISFDFYVHWTEGVANKVIDADQSVVSIVMHTISVQHVYHQAFLNKSIELDDGINKNTYRIRFIGKPTMEWSPRFNGMEPNISYLLLGPQRRVYDTISNKYKMVCDTARGVIKKIPPYGCRDDFRPYFKYDADNEANNQSRQI